MLLRAYSRSDTDVVDIEKQVDANTVFDYDKVREYAKDVRQKGAGVLRWRPNVKWEKDRGRDVESAPWFGVFGGERVNDWHLGLGEKRGA